MSKEEQTKMDQITTEMAEYICDKICRYPREMEQEELDEHCCECEMGRFICEILNTYNDLNNFEKSQSYKLLQKISELRRQLPVFQVGDIAYIINPYTKALYKSKVYKSGTEITGNGIYVEYMSELMSEGMSEVFEFCHDDIGEIVFQSEEEAKQALKAKWRVNMADVPKGQSCKNCTERNECKRKEVAIWCIWYKPQISR